MAKITKERFKVYKNVFDESTLNVIFKLSSRGHFTELVSPLFIGKESNIFSAETSDGSFVVIKIYRVENCNFNRMYDYIRQDPRFMSIKRQRRKVIFAWAQREYRNIFNARDAGVNVPTPMAIMENVLVMELIGNKNVSPPEISPPLKDITLEDPGPYFKKVLDNMIKLHKAGLVHADLSSFNILDKDGEPYLIDFSQATTKENTDYRRLLERDVANICYFFNKNGLELEPEKVFKKIIMS